MAPPGGGNRGRDRIGNLCGRCPGRGQAAYVVPSLDAAPEVLRIGDGSSGGHQLEGLLDEVAVFNIPLEADDILDIMNNGLEVVTGLRAPVEPRGKLAVVWGSLKSEL